MNPFRRFLLAAFLLGALIYGRSLSGAFLWDDNDYVLNNPTLTSAEGLKDIWFDWGATPQYYPLVFSSFWVEHQVWGAFPPGYRLTNLLLHCLNGVLLFVLLAELAVPAAAFAALLFIAHPVHVESVAWISERKNVLSMFFCLLSFLVFWRGVRMEANRSDPARRRAFWLSLLFFVLALLSKTVTSALPVVLALCLFWRHGRIYRSEALALAAMIVAGLPLGLLTVGIEKFFVGMQHVPWPYDVVDRFFIAGRILWFYPLKIVWPSPLMFFYPAWEGPIRNVLAGIGFLSFVGIAFHFLWRARARGVLLCWLAYGVIIFPALGFFPAFPMTFSFTADHFQYLASVPLIVLAALALNRAPQWTKGLLLAGLAVMAWGRTSTFLSVDRLWADTVNKNPGSVVARNNLAVVYLARGRNQDALAQFEQTLPKEPSHVSLTGAGIAALRLGRLNEAEDYLRKSLSLAPAFAQTHAALAETYEALGKPEKARLHAHLGGLR